MKDRNDYLAQLLKANILLLAGPFTDGSGAEAVIQVADEAEAYRIVAADPAVARQILVADAKPWRIEFEHMPGIASGTGEQSQSSSTATRGGGGH
ncbi:MAG TPA: YciI family protein [Fimbriimonadaceae bacterium]|nr:YciI family protein [Fimbriimonadaceae bacterium]